MPTPFLARATAACLMALAVVGCKARKDEAELKVTNSYATTNGPDIVEFDTRFESGPSGCTGTIVGSNTILTAAHCVQGKASDPFLGATFRGRAAARVVKHPSARTPVVAYADIAVLIFDEDIATLEGVTTFRRLARSSPTVGQRVWLVGFGRTDHNVRSYTGKHAGCNTIHSVSSGSFEIVGIARGANRPQPATLDCEASKDDARAGENSSSSYGDSGGPVLAGSDKNRLLGLVSKGGPDPRDRDYIRTDYASFELQETKIWLESLKAPACTAAPCATFSYE